MQLVITMPDVEYEYLANKEKFYSLEKSKQEWLINKTLNRVIDAIPLQKGHGRVIDESKIKNCGWDFIGHHAKTDAPTIIEADVPKRKAGIPLEENDSGYNCEDWIP